MQTQNLATLLAGMEYPGRGIIMGQSEDQNHAIAAYFIMGRSPNSRNRVFVQQQEDIFTSAADPEKLEDPSLIIYAPVRVLGRRTIVTNGDQTDTIYDCLQNGLRFSDALRCRTFEPDAPHYTPRISGLLTQDVESFFYQLSILKTAGGNPASVQRFFFDYPQPVAGRGHFIHTYAANTEPLPSFCGEPVPVLLQGDIDTFTSAVWQALNPENKVSLFVRYIGRQGQQQTRILNRYTQKG